MAESVRQDPTNALEDPYFATEKGLRKYLFDFIYWTFGLPDEVVRVAGDVAVELARDQGPELQAEAQKCRGTGYRKINAEIARAAYELALNLYQKAPSDQKALADTFRRIGILDREEEKWTDSDRAHHFSVVLLEKQDRQLKAIALASWGASKLARAFKEGGQELFMAAAEVLAKSIRKMNREIKQPLIAALTNLVIAEMMAGFPLERLEETFLALQQARHAKSTQGRGKIRVKLSWGIKIYRVKSEEVDLRICRAQAYLVIRQGNYAEAAVGLEKIRGGFLGIGQHYNAASVALDEALVRAILGQWKKAERLVAMAARVFGPGLVVDVAAAIAANRLDRLAASLTVLAKIDSWGCPAIVAAGLQPACGRHLPHGDSNDLFSHRNP